MRKNRRDPAGSAVQSDSRHSMSATCGPRDMISLVTPSLGGGNRNNIRWHQFYDH
jgi:hypothetical protein